jgi:hypothetical protein
MKGIYLYGIRKNTGKGLQVLGIDGKSKATSIPYKDIEAIVSVVDLKEYGSQELAKRAKEDLKWIIKHAKKHEKVIEHAMKQKGNIVPIIPMKFGLIFEKPQNLEDILHKEYQKFKKLLAQFTGKQEWSVKVYAKESALKEKLQSSEKKLQTRIKQTKTLPRGADYFGELEVTKVLDTVMQKKTDELSKKFFKMLGALAFKSKQNKPLAFSSRELRVATRVGKKEKAGRGVRGKNLSQKLVGREEPMVLNSAYLVPERTVPTFVQKAQNLQRSHPEFIFEYTGPWPPYNFV